MASFSLNFQIRLMPLLTITWLSALCYTPLHAQSLPPATQPSATTLGMLTVTDSLRLTLPQAETQFLRQNINLLTAQLGISESQAQQIQAQLRPNPTVYVELMPYNNGSAYASGSAEAGQKRFLPLGQNNSEQVLQVQQLLLMAGKRNKQLALARINTEITRDRFYNLLRTLKYQLRSTFYSLYYNQQSLSVYDQEIAALRQTVDLYQQQYEKNNIPLKDLARLKAYLFGLTMERQQLILRLTNDQADMNVLLNGSPGTLIRPVVDPGEGAAYNPASLKLADLYQLASDNRFDLKSVTDQAQFEQQNLTLQKALAVPDVSVQASFDRNGSFGQNYVGVGVGIPIPVFNRNQGNIQGATVRVQSSQQAIAAYRLQVDSDVQRAYARALQTDQLYRTFDKRFNDDFARLIQGVTVNYRKQNIGVVEFLDFFDSFKNSQIQYSQLQNDRVQSLEELAFAIGKNPFVL